MSSFRSLLERLRSGDIDTPPAAEPPQPRLRLKNAEIAQAFAAVASLEQTAIGAAAGEAGLRNGLRQVFVSLARRNQSLLQRQLRLIDALEHKASDSAALADLFALDHLTTRMRRHAESLAILSGAAPGRSWTEPVPIIDVIRAAMAEVEDYRRVTVLTTSEDAVAAPAVADMIHLLAELTENATMFSPSGTRVEIRAERVANGFAVEIDDRGLGIEPGQLAELNQQLAQPPDFDLANADRLGLFVGAKLAARHGVRVSLRRSPYGGTTAIVLMPTSIIVLVSTAPAAAASTGALPAARRATGRAAGLDLGSGAALALTGRRAVSPPGALPAASTMPSERTARSAGTVPTPGTVPTASSVPTADSTPGTRSVPDAGTVPGAGDGAHRQHAAQRQHGSRGRDRATRDGAPREHRATRELSAPGNTATREHGAGDQRGGWPPPPAPAPHPAGEPVPASAGQPRGPPGADHGAGRRPHSGAGPRSRVVPADGLATRPPGRPA